MTIDSALEKAAGHLEQDRAQLAARTVAETFFLRAVDLSEQPHSSPELFKELAAALRSQKAQTAGWWFRVGVLWGETGAASLASACIAQARSLVNAGTEATEEELIGIADWMPKRSPIASTPPQDEIHKSHSESRFDRLARISQALESWDGSGKSEHGDDAHIAALARSGNRQDALIAALRKPRPRELRLTMIQWWYEERHYAAAIEQLFDIAAEDPVEHWLGDPDSIHGLLTGGRAFQMLGDEATAYAAVQLASLFHDPAAEQDGSDKRNNLTNTLSEALEEVSAARDRLHASITKGFWRGSGSYIVDFLLKADAARRALNYFENRAPTLQQIFPAEALHRQLRHYRGTYGWLGHAESSALAAQGDSLERLELRCKRRPPGVLLPAPTGVRVSWDASASILSMVNRPNMRMAHVTQYQPPPNAVCVPLGFQAGATQRVTTSIGPGCRVVALGAKLDEILPLTMTRHLVEHGYRVLWIDRSERVQHARNSLPANTVRMHVASKAANECRRWLVDASGSAIVRQALVDPGAVPLSYPWRAELDDVTRELWSALPSDSLWRVMQSASRKEAVHDMLALVTASVTGQLRGPECLRRLVSLLEILQRVIEELRIACRINWETPQASRLSPSSGAVAYLQLPVKAARNFSLTALLALNSFLGGARKVPPDDAAEDDFEISFRKLSSTARPPVRMKRLLQGAKSDAQRPPHSRSDNEWVRSGVLAEHDNHPVCVILSGQWGDDIGVALDLLAAHRTTVPHASVLCFADVDGIAQRRRLEYSELLVGSLKPDSICALEIATGISLASRSPTMNSGRSCVLIANRQKSVIRTPFVVWN